MISFFPFHLSPTGGFADEEQLFIMNANQLIDNPQDGACLVESAPSD
jgi:hypothetical protein